MYFATDELIAPILKLPSEVYKYPSFAPLIVQEPTEYPLQVQGNARVTGAIYDSTNSPGTSGQVLQSTVTGTQWTTAASSTLDILEVMLFA